MRSSLSALDSLTRTLALAAGQLAIRESWLVSGLVLSLFAAGPASAQKSAPAPCSFDSPKALLLGPAGAPIPEHGRLGPCADLDGDGDLDLVGAARTLLNDGSGVFRVLRRSKIAAEEHLGLFHADADPHLDLLTREHLARGDGAGGFVDSSADLPAGFTADEALLLDLDGDLDEDILSLVRSPALIRLSANDGAGLFGDASAGLPATPTGAVALAAGDLDGDLDPDLVIACGSSPLHLWRNDGGGVFVDVPGVLPTSLGTVLALAVADLDGDSDLDLALGLDGTNAPYGSAGAAWLRNDGTGSFSQRTLPAGSQATQAVLVLDSEQDGDLDLVLVTSSEFYLVGGMYPASRETTCSLLVNDGTGSFVSSSFHPSVRGWPRGGFVGDLDGDGDTDLVLLDDTYVHRLLLNDGSGGFHETRSATLDLPCCESWRARVVAIGDLNGDALPDVFKPQGILINGPAGVFTPLTAALPSLPYHCLDFVEMLPQAMDVALGDVDGDGDLDAYIGGPGQPCGVPTYGQSNQLWMNDGSAGFSDETATRLPQSGYELGTVLDVELIELDGDGDLDAACLRRFEDDGGRSSHYANDGTGVFTRAGGLGTWAYTGALGDLDGDGDADYFEGSLAGRPNAIWRNDGAANFTLDPGALPAHELSWLAFHSLLADIDGDGDLDLLVTGETPSEFLASFVYVNDGSGRFVNEPARLPLPEVTRPTELEFAGFVDVDLDGDGDLVPVVGHGLWLNDGSGRFEMKLRSMRYFSHQGGVALGDLDLDGDADLVLLDGVRTQVAAGLARHLELLGSARIGQRMTLALHGSPSCPYLLLSSRGTLRAPLGSLGWLLVDPSRLLSTHSGLLDWRGEATHKERIPHDLGLVGQRTYWQAFVGSPTHSTNLVVVELTAL